MSGSEQQSSSDATVFTFHPGNSSQVKLSSAQFSSAGRKKRVYFGKLWLGRSPASASASGGLQAGPLRGDSPQNTASRTPSEEEGGERRKLVQPPFLKISFFRQKRELTGQALPALPACFLACPSDSPPAPQQAAAAAAAESSSLRAGVEDSACGPGSTLPVLGFGELNERERRARATREWSYFGFPCFGVERYSSVVSCWRRRVSGVAPGAAAAGVAGEGAAAAPRSSSSSSCWHRRANWLLLTLSGGLRRLLSKVAVRTKG